MGNTEEEINDFSSARPHPRVAQHLLPLGLSAPPRLQPCSAHLCSSKGSTEGFMSQKRPWGSALQRLLSFNTQRTAGASLHPTEEPKRQHPPSAFSKQTSEALPLPEEIIREAKKQQGEMLTTWCPPGCQFRTPPPCIFRATAPVHTPDCRSSPARPGKG